MDPESSYRKQQLPPAAPGRRAPETSRRAWSRAMTRTAEWRATRACVLVPPPGKRIKPSAVSTRRRSLQVLHVKIRGASSCIADQLFSRQPSFIGSPSPVRRAGRAFGAEVRLRYSKLASRPEQYLPRISLLFSR